MKQFHSFKIPYQLYSIEKRSIHSVWANPNENIISNIFYR